MPPADLVNTARRLACGVVLGVLLCPTPAAAQRSTRRVFHRADIAAAAWHRLGDIVQGLPPGTFATIDGFNQQLGAPGFSPAERSGSNAQWVLRLDGARVASSVGGLWMLDLVPVAITQIDSIVFTTGPALVDGRPSFLGVIDLFTRRPIRGPSATADYQHGDESGDPGPYRYTPRANANVEKLGPFASLRAGYGASLAAIDAAVRYSSLNVTDTNITRRFPGTFGSIQSDVNASGASGVITSALASGEQFTFGGRGRFTGLMHMPFNPDATGRVIATSGGTTGTTTISATTIRYSASGTRLAVDSLGSALPFGFRQERTMLDGFVEAQSHLVPVAVGVGLTSWDSRTASELTQRSERAWLAHDDDRVSLVGAVVHELGHLNLSGTAALKGFVGDSNPVRLSVVRLTDQQASDEGFTMANGTVNYFTQERSLTEGRFEVTGARIPFITPTAYARVFNSLITDRRWMQAAGVQLENRDARRWSVFAAAEVLRHEDYLDRAAPSLTAEARVSARASGGFTLAASGQYAARSPWTSVIDPFDSSAVATVGAGTLPSIRRIDVSVNKSMWRDRMRAQLVVRNLLHTEEQYHPLGAEWNFRTHLAITLDLPPYRNGGAR